MPNAGAQPTADVSLKIAQNAALNPYAGGLPDSVQQQLATHYADLFRVYVKHRDTVERVTFWGVTDGDSWLNDWASAGGAPTIHCSLIAAASPSRPSTQ
ncbi:MAG: endo-1,4-beta-xylanase [Terracidiphilus sp.]